MASVSRNVEHHQGPATGEDRRKVRIARARVAGVVLQAIGLVAAGAATGSAQAGMVFSGLRLSEIRVDQSGADTDEYFEIAGDPFATLKGWWFLAVGDSGTDTGGVIEMAVNLSAYSLGANGYFVGHESTFGSGVFQGQSLTVHPDAAHASVGSGDSLNFENSDNVTYMLVRGFAGSVGTDLDTNNDGFFDVLWWTDLADSVSFVSLASTDLFYSTNTVGPVSYTGTGGMPAHAWWNGNRWEAGMFSSWELDTPGQGPIVPGPGTLALGLAAGAVGRGYHRASRCS